MANKLHYSFWVLLRAKQSWGYLSAIKGVKATITKPTVKDFEIAVKVNVEIPEYLFQKPQLEFMVQIPDGDAPKPLDAHIQENIARAIREASGMNVTLCVDESESSDDKPAE